MNVDDDDSSFFLEILFGQASQLHLEELFERQSCCLSLSSSIIISVCLSSGLWWDFDATAAISCASWLLESFKFAELLHPRFALWSDFDAESAIFTKASLQERQTWLESSPTVHKPQHGFLQNTHFWFVVEQQQEVGTESFSCGFFKLGFLGELTWNHIL